MPFPVIAAGIFASVGFIGGALLRQPEINRLKKQVLLLQQENERLKEIIKEQQRQIVDLKKRYDSLSFVHFIQKNELQSDIKFKILVFCAFKEYSNLSMQKIKGVQLSEEQNKFLKIYELLTTGNEDKVDDESLDFLIDYISERYAEEISEMDVPSFDKEFNSIMSFK